MQTAPQISFHGFEASDSLRALILQRIAHLEGHFPSLVSVRCAVEQPHRHQRQGRHFHVHLQLGLPGREVVVDRETERSARHEDAYAAVRDAFERAERRLKAQLGKQRRPAQPRAAV